MTVTISLVRPTKELKKRVTPDGVTLFLEEPNGLDAHKNKLCISKATIISSLFSFIYSLETTIFSEELREKSEKIKEQKETNGLDASNFIPLLPPFLPD